MMVPKLNAQSTAAAYHRRIGLRFALRLIDLWKIGRSACLCMELLSVRREYIRVLYSFLILHILRKSIRTLY